MGIGVSILLIAIGAILLWAVNAEVAKMDLDAIGVILLVVGALGALLSLMFWSSWAAGAAGARHRRRLRRQTARGVPRRARTAPR